MDRLYQTPGRKPILARSEWSVQNNCTYSRYKNFYNQKTNAKMLNESDESKYYYRYSRNKTTPDNNTSKRSLHEYIESVDTIIDTLGNNHS